MRDDKRRKMRGRGYRERKKGRRHARKKGGRGYRERKRGRKGERVRKEEVREGL